MAQRVLLVVVVGYRRTDPGAQAAGIRPGWSPLDAKGDNDNVIVVTPQ